MRSQIYNQAKYYEIAFSFINAKKQADLFEKFIRTYSRIKVRRILDIACGTALQLRELAKRGHITIGLDVNSQMIRYLKKTSLAEKLDIEVVKADMNAFKLKKRVDFAYIMMGSIVYAKNNDLFLSHLKSVASSLRSGGLYLIENIPIHWTDPTFFKKQTWITKKEGVEIKTTYQILPKNPLKQEITQILKMEIKNNGIEREFIDKDDLKIIFPEEIKLLIEKNNEFEFLGFFHRNKVKLLKEISPNNILVLRKK